MISRLRFVGVGAVCLAMVAVVSASVQQVGVERELTTSILSVYTPPTCVPGVPFVDIICTTGFDAWIDQFGLDSITAGWGGGKYCPGTPVTRDPAGRAPPGPYRAAFPGGVQGIEVRTHSGGSSALVSRIGQKCS